MGEAENLTNNKNEIARTERFARLTKLLTVYFAKWRLVFPTHEVSNQQLGVYLEMLEDLTEAQIAFGCREAGKIAHSFPKPADIREAASLMGKDGEYLGLPALQYPEVSQEERDQAIEETKEIARRLTETAKKLSIPAKVSAPAVQRSLAEQKAILRKKGFIK